MFHRHAPSDQVIRCLGNLRLSLEGDHTTSPERQHDTLRRITDRDDRELIAVAEDLNVSGRTNPMERAGLGPWFRDLVPACKTSECGHTPENPCMGQWDAIAAWKMDRITRRAIHFHILMDWMKTYGKAIITDDGIDTTTPSGKIMAEMMAMVASWEWQAIQDRNMEATEKHRAMGYWKGGPVPYGWVPVRDPNRKGKYFLFFEEDTIRWVELMVNLAWEGHSTGHIARKLEERGAVAPAEWKERKRLIKAGKLTEEEAAERDPGQWHPGAVYALITNRVITGESWHNGRPVRNDEGEVVMRAQQLITREKFEALQKKLAARANPSATATKASMFLRDVAYCLNCGRPEYGVVGHRNEKGEVEYKYLRCASANGTRKCHPEVKTIRMDAVKVMIEQYFLDRVGDERAMRREFHAGNDVGERLEEVNLLIQDIRAEKDAGLYRYQGGSEEYIARLKKLTDRKVSLESQEAIKPHFEWVETGETYRQTWEKLSWSERGELLRECGVTSKVWPTGNKKNPARVLLDFPDDMVERLREFTAVPVG
ncbi:recombinase family protein [Streptomyces sp. NPDC086554]|uniref:recombinase family protein n=1 Tax=Streptomyces sp. NPDC086554 TaxID=3154864 RepID=UPI00344460B0